MSNHLIQLAAQYPHAAQFVIAHSHGGNVASYALRNESLQARIRGVVYLATPHLQCRARDLDRTLSFFFLFLLPVSAFLAAIPVGAVGGVCMSMIAGSEFVETAWWIVTILGLSLFAIFCWWINKRLDAFARSRLEAKLAKRQFETEERYSPPFLATPRVLNVSTPLDEAGFHLRLLRFLAGIPFALWNPAVLLLLCGTLQVLSVLSILFFVLGSTAREFAQPGLRDPNPGAAYAGSFLGIVLALTAPVLLFGLIALFVHLLMLLIPKVIRGQFYGFGGETLSDNLLVDIEVADAPFAADVDDLRRLISPLSFKKRAWFPGLRLAHSAIYDDEYILSKIVAWIAASAAVQARRSRPLRVRSAANPLGL